MPKHIRDLSCSVSSFKYQLDKYLGTIPDTPCIANYDNSLENSSHTNPHFLTGVHPVCYILVLMTSQLIALFVFPRTLLSSSGLQNMYVSFWRLPGFFLILV